MAKRLKRTSIEIWKCLEVLAQSGAAALLGAMMMPQVEHAWIVAGALVALAYSLESEARKGTVNNWSP